MKRVALIIPIVCSLLGCALPFPTATADGSGLAAVAHQAAPPPSPCPPVVGIGAVHGGCYGITTDKTQYQVGDTVKYCYTVPGPAGVRVTDIQPGGGTAVLLDGNDDGTGDCKQTTVTPPAGQECLQLQVQYGGATYQAQTCFQVGSAPQPTATPTPGAGPSVCQSGSQVTAVEGGCYAISISKTQFEVGDILSYCYTVPGPAHIRVSVLLPDGSSEVLLEGDDTGTGDCRKVLVGLPIGQKCLQLQLEYRGGTYQTQVCYLVSQTQTPPPTSTPSPTPTPSPIATPSPTPSPLPTPTPRTTAPPIPRRTSTPRPEPTPTPRPARPSFSFHGVQALDDHFAPQTTFPAGAAGYLKLTWALRHVRGSTPMAIAASFLRPVRGGWRQFFANVLPEATGDGEQSQVLPFRAPIHYPAMRIAVRIRILGRWSRARSATIYVRQ